MRHTASTLSAGALLLTLGLTACTASPDNVRYPLLPAHAAPGFS